MNKLGVGRCLLYLKDWGVELHVGGAVHLDSRSTIFCVWSTEQTHFALAFSFSGWVLNTGLRLAQLCFNCLHTLRNLGRVKKTTDNLRSGWPRGGGCACVAKLHNCTGHPPPSRSYLDQASDICCRQNIRAVAEHHSPLPCGLGVISIWRRWWYCAASNHSWESNRGNWILMLTWPRFTA